MTAPRVVRESPPPLTPKRRKGGHLDDLLLQFQSKSSPTSVTKDRRESNNSLSTASTQRTDLSKAGHSEQEQQARTTRRRFAASSLPPHAVPPTESLPSPLASTQKISKALSDTSEDELAPSAVKRAPPSLQRPSTRASRKREPMRSRHRLLGEPETLVMEGRRKTTTEELPSRRALRSQKGDILESDAPGNTLHQRSVRQIHAPNVKVDTARKRLRMDIALQTKAKADNFLVANQQFFQPLLPAQNYISKLITRNSCGPIINYVELASQPKGVTAKMKKYQLSGLSFLVHLHNNGFSGILGDEMGLGKTLQTLSLFQFLEEQDKKLSVNSEELRPYLVVCPLSVLNSWVSEARKWVPALKVLRFHGTVNERNRLKRVALGVEDQYGQETNKQKNRLASRKVGIKMSATENFDGESYRIIVTTYETFQAEQAWFKHSFFWRYAVLDEGHKIKNSVAQIASALRNISAEHRLILTGTPLQNNLVEMWALLAWLYPDVFTSNTRDLFRESFDLTQGRVNRQIMDDARRLLEIVMLRRMKDSPGVDLGLPPKEEVLLYVPLTPMQRFWYTRLLTRMGDAMLDDLFSNVHEKEIESIKKDKEEDVLFSRLKKLETVTKNGEEWDETATIMKKALELEQGDANAGNAWRRLMNLVLQLRKCCSHPYLLPGALPDPYYLGEHVVRASGKFIVLEKLLKHSVFKQGKKVLIFSGFTATLNCCEDLLILLGEQEGGFKYLRLDGSTARARRNLDIRMFNDASSEYRVMLLSTRAGGLGINLTSAEDVIFLDEDWNPQITLQAEARAHRIGQTKKVTIYKLCTQGTVEEQMMGRIRKKLYLSAKITESMRNVYTKAFVSTQSVSSDTNDVPQMDTSQLKSLVRRGAQTLSHPNINVTEMLSWDFETMLKKCRDTPSDPYSSSDVLTSEVDEEKWLSVMERVECAVFDGQRYHRKRDMKDADSNVNMLPADVSREDRRSGKNTTVMVNGFAISKESMACADWEAVPTLAGKDPRLAEPKREKRSDIPHEEHCLMCFEATGKLISCKSCPRAYHIACLPLEFQAKVRGWNGFYCPQHECFDCTKKTVDAGGLIYRCRWCERGYCEDCLDWDQTDLLGENVPEFEMLGEGPATQAFYIKCPSCKELAQNDEERKHWVEAMEQNYREQHEMWLKAEDRRRREGIEAEGVLLEHETGAERGCLSEASHVHNTFLRDSDVESTPALTDTSRATPAERSGVTTPTIALTSHAKVSSGPQIFKETRSGKKRGIRFLESRRSSNASLPSTQLEDYGKRPQKKARINRQAV